VAAAAVGVATIDRRFVSNGSGALPSYELSATAVAVQATAAWSRPLGRLGLLGVDGSYVYAVGARVRYHDATTTALLGLSQHDAGLGVTVGLRSRAAGGIDGWLRGGAALAVTVIDPNATVRLTSDRLIAPTVALGFDANRIAAPRDHAIGLHLFARGVLDGQLTENISDGAGGGTWGATLGGSVSAELWRSPGRGQVLLALAYSYGFTVSPFSGASARDPSATRSTLGCAQHLATAGLGYAY
jgi:hypothetical protein